MKKIKAHLIAGLAVMASGAYSNASMIVTHAEAPGQEVTSLNQTSVFDFNGLTANTKYTNLVWTGVGQFDSIYVKSENAYGGATTNGTTTTVNGSNYSVQSTSVGSPNNVVQTTLTLNSPIAYFGLWWSAGDSKNVLDFYSGNTKLAEFTTPNLLSKLPADFKGNPNSGTYNGQDSSEPFAFINFYGENGVTWDKIVFRNNGSSGFEADNYTVRSQAWGTIPGESGPVPGVTVETLQTTPVPEPGQVAGSLLVLMGVSGCGMRRWLAHRSNRE